MAKTHFVIRVDDHTKRLISIRENDKGRLIITWHKKGIFRTDLGPSAMLLEYKYTLHPSAKSQTQATTAHKTATYANGYRDDKFVLTQATRNGTFQPLEITTVIRPIEAPPYVPPKKDQVLDLGAYDPRTHTMYIALWFAAADTKAPELQHCSVSVARLRRFSVAVLYCFTARPTPEHGSSLYYFTSSAERLSPQEVVAGRVPGLSQGVPSSMAEYVAVRDFNKLVLGAEFIPVPALVPESQASAVERPLFSRVPES